MAERVGLENRYGRKAIVSSNLTLAVLYGTNLAPTAEALGVSIEKLIK